MMTTARPLFAITGRAARRRSGWPVAIAEAVICACAALWVGPAGIDPAVGFRR